MTTPAAKSSSVLIRLLHVISIIAVIGSSLLATYAVYLNNHNSNASLPSELAVKKVATDEVMWASVGWGLTCLVAFLICKAAYYIFKGEIEPEDEKTSGEVVTLFIISIVVAAGTALAVWGSALP
jgi:uncharacterized membrane protein